MLLKQKSDRNESDFCFTNLASDTYDMNSGKDSPILYAFRVPSDRSPRQRWCFLDQADLLPDYYGYRSSSDSLHDPFVSPAMTSSYVQSSAAANDWP